MDVDLGDDDFDGFARSFWPVSVTFNRTREEGKGPAVFFSITIIYLLN